MLTPPRLIEDLVLAQDYQMVTGTLGGREISSGRLRGDQLRFVVLEALARPAVLTAPDPALLTAAYAEISRDAR